MLKRMRETPFATSSSFSLVLGGLGASSKESGKTMVSSCLEASSALKRSFAPHATSWGLVLGWMHGSSHVIYPRYEEKACEGPFHRSIGLFT